MTKSAKRRERREAQFREASPAKQETPPVEAPQQPEEAAGPSVRDQVRASIRRGRINIPGPSGEPFDAFRSRYLSAMRGVMQQKAFEPGVTPVVITHPVGLRVLNAWLKNGAPDDLSIRPEAMEEPAPEGIAELAPNQDGDWAISPLNMEERHPLNPSAILLASHGGTPDKAAYQQGETQQNALALIAKHTRSMDFGRVRAVAQKSGLSDDEIGQAIDGSLPTPEEAGNLPPHQLLAVASAAGPEKRREYAPLLRQYFGNIGHLAEPDKTALGQHLRDIGMEG